MPKKFSDKETLKFVIIRYIERPCLKDHCRAVMLFVTQPLSVVLSENWFWSTLTRKIHLENPH